MSLKSFLETASRAYYDGEPIISDIEYDRLEALLGEQLLVGESDIFQPHAYRMYSLNKHYPEKDGTHEFQKRSDVVRTPKLDGLATSVLMSGDDLVMALTRGDGKRGKPITDKVQNLRPWKQNFNDFSRVTRSAVGLGVYQVTGELVAHIDVPNSRNAASGSLGLKEGFIERAEEIGLTFIAYDIVGDNIDCETYTEKLKLLGQLGYTTILDEHLDANFPTDGEVLRLNSMAEFNQLGYTDKFPRGAVALKKVTETKSTKLIDVVWQTGGSGRITPVAILEPVELGGATVSRATLNNIAYIKALDLSIGDMVDVVRSGEIIPKIVGKTAL